MIKWNWILFFTISIFCFIYATPDFTKGIVFGGLIVTINFHLLYKTLKSAFSPPFRASPNVVLVKYYIRFIISGFIFFVLISGHYVDPLGLVVGLSIVVASITLATIVELKKLFFKEAV